MKNFVMGMTILVLLQLSLPFFKRHSSESEEITYTKDAKPIFEKRCSACHNASTPERNWLDYDKAFTHRKHIKHRLQNQTMPPGNSTNMTKEERNTIIQWVDSGGKK